MSKIEITYKPLDGGAMVLRALPLLQEQEIRKLQRSAIKGFAAIYGREVVGVLLYDLRDRFLVMHRVAVSPQYQRNGVGTGMVEMLCSLADAKKYELVFSFEGENNQEPFYRFVASMQAFHMERQGGFEAVLRADDVRELCRKYSNGHTDDPKFFDLSKKVREEFLEQLERVYPEIVDEIRNDNEAYSRKLCCCSVSHGQVQAACFIKDFGAEMELKLLYSLPERGVLAAKALMQSIANLDQEKLVPIRVAPTGEAAVKIIDGLCPSYKIEKRIYMAYYMGRLA